MLESWPVLRALRKTAGEPWRDWEISELKSRSNWTVSELTWRRVEGWLDEYALSA